MFRKTLSFAVAAMAFTLIFGTADAQARHGRRHCRHHQGCQTSYSGCQSNNGCGSNYGGCGGGCGDVNNSVSGMQPTYPNAGGNPNVNVGGDPGINAQVDANVRPSVLIPATPVVPAVVPAAGL